MKKILSTNTKAAAAPQAEPPAAGPGPRPKILKTSDLPGGSRTAEIDDKNFVASMATPEELVELRARIERRQAPVPDQPEVILICQNQKCRAWAAYPPKQAARSEDKLCIFCNPGTRRDGGRLRKATPAETQLFWNEKKRRDEIWKLRMRQQAEAELERRRLGIHLELGERRIGPSIADDPTIKRGFGR